MEWHGGQSIYCCFTNRTHGRGIKSSSFELKLVEDILIPNKKVTILVKLKLMLCSKRN